MNRLDLAVRSFFWILFHKRFAQKVNAFFEPAHAPREEEQAPPAPPPAVRNDAVTLLALLQREARLVDFLKEPIDGYDDAQIGAAVRDVHRDAGAALERVFAIRPLRDESEGATVEAPPGFDPGRIVLSGNVSGKPPYKGTLRHHGWTTTKNDLPVWKGADQSAPVVAPAEIEL
jgi:hypothetical protein